MDYSETGGAIILALIGGFGFYLLARRRQRLSDFQRLLAKRRSPDEAVASSARHDLTYAFDLEIFQEDLPLIHQALLEPFDDDDEPFSTREALVTLFWRVRDRSTLDFLQRRFDGLGENPGTLSAALRVFFSSGSMHALEQVCRIVEDHAPNVKRCEASWILLPMETQFAEIFFPRLLPALVNSGLKSQFYYLASSLARAGALEPRHLSGHEAQMVADLRAAVKQVADHIGTVPEGHDAEIEREDDVHDLLSLASIVRFLPPSDALRDALLPVGRFPQEVSWHAGMCSDVRVSAFVSLVALGLQIDEADWKRFCTQPHLRFQLYDSLGDADRLNRIPAAYRAFFTEELLALGDLAHWLASPFEMTAPPEGIEVVDVRRGTLEEREVRYYILRFFYRPGAESNHMPTGWMLGVSGPWDAGSAVPAIAGESRDTSSSFESESATDVDAFFAAFIEGRSEVFRPQSQPTGDAAGPSRKRA